MRTFIQSTAVMLSLAAVGFAVTLRHWECALAFASCALFVVAIMVRERGSVRR